jgi:ferredoxin-NADP reductase
MDAFTRIKTTTPSPYPLTAILVDTHDTKTFRFGLPADATLDMLPGDHLYVHATINGKSVKRPYTPSSLPGTAGFFDLTVKRYETGVISKYLHDQRVGDNVLMSGPRQGGHWVDGMAKKVGFVAGGTGITPMISIIRWILTRRYDAELFLVFANKTEADIIFERNGNGMSELIRTSTVTMSRNSRRLDGQREKGESLLIFFAAIFLLLVQRPSSSSAGHRRCRMPWKRYFEGSTIQKSL